MEKPKIEFTIDELNSLLMSLNKEKPKDKELVKKIELVYQNAFRKSFDDLEPFNFTSENN
jgi:hypothetical protein